MYKLSEKALLFVRLCLCVIAALLIIQIFKSHADAGRESALFIASFSILFSVSMFWEMRGSIWFWIVIGVTIVFHVLLVILVPWPRPSSGSGRGIGFIAAVDAGIICGAFTLVKKSIIKNVDQDSEGK